MAINQFFETLRSEIDTSRAIPEEFRPHPHSPPVQLKSVLLSHLDLVIQVANADPDKQRFGIESAKASWRQVLEVISKYGLLENYKDDNELKTELQKFFNG